jgi:cell division protein FtsB
MSAASGRQERVGSLWYGEVMCEICEQLRREMEAEEATMQAKLAEREAEVVALRAELAGLKAQEAALLKRQARRERNLRLSGKR